MVKLHSNACAKGLIAVMGDTPELVESDSELDFVEVSFGPICQTFAALCQPYEAPNIDPAPVWQR
jgi:hypothetical protein